MRDRRWKNVGAYLVATRRLGRIAGIEIQFDSFFGRGNDAADRFWLFNNKQEEEQWTIQNIQTFLCNNARDITTCDYCYERHICLRCT